MKCLFIKLFLGTGHANKSDEFSERFQTAVDPHPSEWSPSLEIMCLHFILSGPCTSMHIFENTHCKKMQHNFLKMRGVEGGLEFFRKFIRFGSAILPLVTNITNGAKYTNDTNVAIFLQTCFF